MRESLRAYGKRKERKECPAGTPACGRPPDSGVTVGQGSAGGRGVFFGQTEPNRFGIGMLGQNRTELG